MPHSQRSKPLSLSSQSFSLPYGAGRSAFEAAARSFEASRQISGPAPAQRLPAEGASVEGAIANAARQTGVDFEFLLAQARVESALDPAAKARTSSATGLYQFIESTWLGTLKRHGARFGLGAIADAIAIDAGGGAYVADPARRSDILALRNNPQIAAWMAAGLAEDNAAHLRPILGRDPDHGELYLAHFLGAGGAGRFLSAMQDNPGTSAASLFAKAASANTPIFYEPDGRERSLAGVMAHLGAKMERAMGLAAGSRADRAGPLLPPAAPLRMAQVSGPAAPYLVADESVFLPLSPLPLAGGSLSGASNAMPGRSRSGRAALSDVLSSTFGAGGAMNGTGNLAPSRAEAQVRRAYQQLRAFGL